MSSFFRLFLFSCITATVLLAFSGEGHAATPAGWQSVVPLLSKANAAAGEKQSHICSSCHTFDKGGGRRLGPNLYGIVNSGIATVPGFPFSDALTSMKGKKWTYEALDQYLYSPKEFAPGTRMTFGGVKDAQARASLIAWLRKQSDKPAPLPKK